MAKTSFSIVLLLLASALLLAGCVKQGELRVAEGKPVTGTEAASAAASQQPYVPQGGSPEATAEAPATATATPAAVDSAPSSSEAEVSVSEAGFDPIQVRLSVGGRVKFTNTGTGLHDVVFIDRESEALAPGESYQTTFPTAGSYGVSDSFNPAASGAVEVG